MRHAGREEAERRQPLFVLQLALETYPIGDVADDEHPRAIRDVGRERARGDRHFFLDAVAVDEVCRHRPRVLAKQLLIWREERRDRFFVVLAADEVPERLVRGQDRIIARDDGNRGRRRLDDRFVVVLQRPDLIQLAAQAAVQARVLDGESNRRGERLEEVQVVARQRLLAALLSEEQQPLQLAAVPQREDVTIAGAQQLDVRRIRQPRLGEHQRRVPAELPEIARERPPRQLGLGVIDDE